MTLPILKTKLYIPPTRPTVVARPHLIERLNAGLQRKLALICAPAGFGKTTLLSQWVHSLTACARPTKEEERAAERAGGTGVRAAWLSLEKGDNEPERFWTYVIAALQTAQVGLGEDSLERLASGMSPSSDLVMSGLINELIEPGAKVVLVLDDFHHMDAPAIQETLSFLLDHLPPRLHLVIAGRADPPLPLSRLRGQGQLNELRAADLRFTSSEVATFLNQTMELGLSEEDITALGDKTEGWIAGLQLAALWLQGQDREQIAGSLTALGGSHRYILDYLTEEVLERQPEDIQSFLLQTSILDSLSGPLCDAVAGIGGATGLRPGSGVPSRTFANSQSLLEHLERSNLFVVPLDDERRWYRYHHLFGDLLRNRLEQTQPEQVRALHMTASAWYEDSGMITEAVGHALAADNVERVARLVSRNAFALLARGELTTLVRQLDALPEEVVRTRPWLRIARAWVGAYAGPIDAVETHLQAAAGVLEDLRPGEAQHITGHMTTIRAYKAALEGQVDRAVELSSHALELLPGGDRAARGFAATLLASVLRWRGDLQLAAQAYAEAIDISRASGDIEIAIDTLCDVATLQTWQGLLHAAAATCKEAIHLAEEHAKESGRRSLETGYAYVRLAVVLREWDDLEAALRCARQGLDLVSQWGQLHYLSLCHMEMAKTLHAHGDTDGALEAIQRAKEFAQKISPWYVARAEAWEARLWLAQGNLEAAAAWAGQSGLAVDDDLGFHLKECYLALARVCLAQDRLVETRHLLTRLLEMFERAEATGYTIETLVLQALACQAQGQIDQALTTLERALILGKSQGYVRTFIEEHLPLAALLRQVAIRGVAPEYIRRLLTALEGRDSRGIKPLPLPAGQVLAEPLSDREMEVLDLLAAGLPNKEIADRLVIALGTVKNHLKNIYGKLGVHTRVQAVARARELGLL